jgi:hypothetical protein
MGARLRQRGFYIAYTATRPKAYTSDVIRVHGGMCLHTEDKMFPFVDILKERILNLGSFDTAEITSIFEFKSMGDYDMFHKNKNPDTEGPFNL